LEEVDFIVRKTSSIIRFSKSKELLQQKVKVGDSDEGID
jgi:hypothetical protein